MPHASSFPYEEPPRLTGFFLPRLRHLLVSPLTYLPPFGVELITWCVPESQRTTKPLGNLDYLITPLQSKLPHL